MTCFQRSDPGPAGVTGAHLAVSEVSLDRRPRASAVTVEPPPRPTPGTHADPVPEQQAERQLQKPQHRVPLDDHPPHGASSGCQRQAHRDGNDGYQDIVGRCRSTCPSVRGHNHSLPDSQRQRCSNHGDRHQIFAITCPLKSRESWRTLKRRQPVLFARACWLEAVLNNRRRELGRDPVWLTRHNRPPRRDPR